MSIVPNVSNVPKRSLKEYADLFGGIFTTLIELGSDKPEQNLSEFKSEPESDYYSQAIKHIDTILDNKLRNPYSIPDEIRNWINSPVLDDLINSRQDSIINTILSYYDNNRKKSRVESGSNLALWYLKNGQKKFYIEELPGVFAKGDLRFSKHLYNKFGGAVMNTKTFLVVLKAGRLNKVKWMHNILTSMGCTIDPVECLVCIIHGGNRVNNLKWLLKTYPKIDIDKLPNIKIGLNGFGNVDPQIVYRKLKLLFRDFPENKRKFVYNSWYNALALLLDSASGKQYVKLILLFYDTFPNIVNIHESSDLFFKYCAKWDEFSVLKQIVKRHSPICKVAYYQAFIDSVTNHHEKIARWLPTVFPDILDMKLNVKLLAKNMDEEASKLLSSILLQ